MRQTLLTVLLLFAASVTVAQNVGIGEATPNQRLDVRGQTNQAVLVRINQTGTDAEAGLRLDRDASPAWFIGLNTTDGSRLNALRFLDAAATERVIFTSDGNVGIGTSTPGNRLTVYNTGSGNVDGIGLYSGAAGSHVSFGIGRTANDFQIGVAGGAGAYNPVAVAGDVVQRTVTATNVLYLANGSTNVPAVSIDNNVTIIRNLAVRDVQQATGIAYNTVGGNLGSTTIGGPDNQYHRVVCPDGYAMQNLAVYAGAQLDGGLRCDCVPLGEAITTTHVWRTQNALVSNPNTPDNTQGTADNLTHYAQCASNEVATGFEAYSATYLDGRIKLRCTALSNVSTANNGFGSRATLSVPWANGQDDQYHFTGCPVGTFMRGISIYASGTYLDGNMEAGCTGLVP